MTTYPLPLSAAARLAALLYELNLTGLTLIFVGAVLVAASTRGALTRVGGLLGVVGAAFVLVALVVQHHWLGT